MSLGYADDSCLKEFTLREKGRLRDWSPRHKLTDDRALHRQLRDQAF